MPLYDYECKKCETLFEEHMRMVDNLVPTKRPCPNCGAKQVKQVLFSLNIGDPVRLGVIRPSSEFNEVLEKINDRTPRGNLHQKLSQGRRKPGLN